MRLIVIAALVVLAGCTPDPSIEKQKAMPRDAMQIKADDRIQVKLISKFSDDLAYGQERGVYIVTDQQSGKEFIGISGIGIAEIGSHKLGKATISDER